VKKDEHRISGVGGGSGRARRPIPGSYRPSSPLYDRYNGFTLGTFVVVACHSSSLSRARIRFLRRRVDEFLLEIGTAVAWPRRRGDAYPGKFVNRVTNVAAARSPELGRFTAIGALATSTIINAHALLPSRTGMTIPRWATQLKQLGIPGLEIEKWLRSVARPRGSRIGLERVLSLAAVLMALVVESVPSERDSCFVSLPFKEPFLGLYESLYRPALHKAGFRSIRAWGGLTTEEYAMSLLTLVSRCGALLADITTSNVNVIHEVGLAHGMIRPAFLLAREGVTVPSNLSHLSIITYPPRLQKVPGSLVSRAAHRIAGVWGDYAGRLEEMAADYRLRVNDIWPSAGPVWR
jgi:hypothetical protein